jgi:hypothetical protein
MKVIYRIELQRDTTNLKEIGPKVVENKRLRFSYVELYHGIKRPNTKGVLAIGQPI